MLSIEIQTGGHDWQKQNLVTIQGKGNYDIYKCSGCGMTGKSRTLGYIQVKASYSSDRINSCPGNTKVPTSVKVIHCAAFGDHFDNLKPGTIHDVIAPPPNEKSKNDNSGVWVMGVGVPVRLLSGEYKAV